MRNKLLWISLIVGISLILVGSIIFLGSKIRTSGRPEFQKGMHYVTWSKNGYATERSDKSLEKIASLGSNWVAILSTWYQDTCFTTKIFPTRKTPGDASIIRAIKSAHANNLKVMLKPHLDIVDTTYGGWRGEIACIKEPDWIVWFDNYKKFIMHYVDIANEHDVEMFCVGTELTEATLAKPEMWRSLIKDVKKVYKGKITYAANWNNEYTNIAFWNEVDYAGIDAYFPLSDKARPTVEDLKKGWKQWVAEIEKWQARIKKPVIFPEIGYHSSEYAAKEPWTHISNSKLDLEVQENCYRAMLEVFWDKSWFYGIYWWDWGTSVKMGGNRNRGFTPQNKSAEDLLRKWYSKKR